MIRTSCWAALAAIAGLMTACSSGEQLIVYSPHGPEMRQAYEDKFEAANPGVDVQILNMSSQEVYNKIYAERNRPACDVWWGAPSTMFTQAAAQGLLAQYTPSWADKVDAAYKDGQERWYGTYRLPIVIVYNDQEYEQDEVAQTWDELASPAWNQKVAMRRPLESGTLRTFIGAMVQRGTTDEAGFDYLRKVHHNTAAYLEKPQFLFDHLKRNPQKITVWLMTDAMMQRELNGYPFWFVVPPGTPVLTDCIGIVEDAPNRELAEKFYEFVTSKEALTDMAQNYAKFPARNDIAEDALPGWMTEQAIDPLPIDWDEMAEKGAEWCDRWDQEVFNADE